MTATLKALLATAILTLATATGLLFWTTNDDPELAFSLDYIQI